MVNFLLSLTYSAHCIDIRARWIGRKWKESRQCARFTSNYGVWFSVSPISSTSALGSSSHSLILTIGDLVRRKYLLEVEWKWRGLLSWYSFRGVWGDRTGEHWGYMRDRRWRMGLTWNGGWGSEDNYGIGFQNSRGFLRELGQRENPRGFLEVFLLVYGKVRTAEGHELITALRWAKSTVIMWNSFVKRSRSLCCSR